MLDKKFTFQSSKSVLIILILIPLIATGVWGANQVLASRAAKRAEVLMKKDFAVLAEDAIDPYRRTLIVKAEGCHLLLNIYYRTQDLVRLAWASEACLDAGQEVPAAYLGIAASREAQGHDVESLQILQTGAQKFPTSAEFPYRMSVLFKKNKQKDQAVAALMKASQLAPENKQISLEALQYFSSIERWSEAREMADRLKSVPIENPEAKLVIARALQRGGDMGSARELVNSVRKLLGGKPALQKALEQTYADVFKNAS
jgi:tetratricopeptide (TPR) repeat protein